MESEHLLIEVSDSDISEDEHQEEINEEGMETEKYDEGEEDERDEMKNLDGDEVLITLSAMRKKTQWRFPNTTTCPHRGCQVPFENSSETIQHFIKTHVLTAVWCSICRTTVTSKYYGVHFKKTHPDMPLSPNWRHILQKYICKKCGAKVSVDCFKQHVEEKHTAPIVCCPFTACTYQTRRVRSVRQHWAKHHSDQPFPHSRAKK